MVGIHFDGTVILMEPNTSVYLIAHFLARRCPSSSRETKSAPCLFLASWSIVQAAFWVDLSAINKMFKASGNSLMAILFALSGAPLWRSPSFHTTWAGEIWSKSAAHRDSLKGFWKGSKLELLLGQTWACKCSNQIILFQKLQTF